LPGVLRAALLAGAPDIVVRSLTNADIRGASAAAVTNALQGVRPVSRWDDRALDVFDPLIGRLKNAVIA
jgi:branched-subunit amino acid aminotransferase/4-amino-4-deoxychorismate lyase